MHEIIKIVASYFIVIPVAAVIGLFIKLDNPNRKQLVVYLAIGGILSIILAKIGSHLYNDPRPFVVKHVTPLIAHGADNGFPSDHTLLSAFVGFALLKYSQRLGLALLLVAALIGAARVLANVHHVTDIVGSFGFAAAGVGIALLVTKRLFKPRNA
jgi:undecaprenyl-diphosphatase